MCGIVGWVGIDAELRVEPGTIDRMNALLTHRGPDTAGSVTFANGALAMSRLQVIDLESGDQPMASEDEATWLVYNGETYNFRELRRELTSRGHRFRTRSDTETVLEGYRAWGDAVVDRLRGMFAFAAADTAGDPGQRRIRRLLLARDPVGKKPLFYTVQQGRLIFASEIKAILAHPGVARRIRTDAIPGYLAHGYVPGERTLFEGILELPPGHLLVLEDGEIRVKRYWTPRYGPPFEATEAEILQGVRDRVEESVRIRLVSDVPLGAFLSGGLDSSAVVALMQRHMDEPVRTFSIGFAGDESFNELPYARQVAGLLGTEHQEFVVEPDALSLLPTLIWHHDQPFGDSSAIPTYLVARHTREHVTVALTGDGGDELFGGYERFAAAGLAEQYSRLPRPLRAGVETMLRALPESTDYRNPVRRARSFVENAARNASSRYLGWVGVFAPSLIESLVGQGAGATVEDEFEAVFRSAGDVDPLTRLLYVNAVTYLPGDLLVKTDRMTMAAALEARSPFLDRELFDYAARIPASLKVRGLRTKHVLKKAMEPLLPRRIVHRRKHGFGVPIGRWFRGELSQHLEAVLLAPETLDRGYFDPSAVRTMVREHVDGRRDHAHRLWTLLTFEHWHRMYLDSDAWRAPLPGHSSGVEMASRPK